MFYLGSPLVITAVTTILPVVHTKKTRHTNNTLKAVHNITCEINKTKIKLYSLTFLCVTTILNV